MKQLMCDFDYDKIHKKKKKKENQSHKDQMKLS